MTLLASERSLLIRNKFRSVLQLRIQNRRQNEINADSALKSSSPPEKKDQNEAVHLPDDSATQTLPPGGQNAETTTPDRTVSAPQRQKKARQVQELSEKIQCPPGTVGQQNTRPLENLPASFPLSADVFEEDISSCSSSSSHTEQHGVHRPPAFSSRPGLSGDQLLGELSMVGQPLSQSPRHGQAGLSMPPATEGIRQPISITLGDSNAIATNGRPNGMFLTSQATPLLPKTAQPPSPPCSSTLASSLNFSHLPRSRKPRDAKPKMRKLKYHQYIPPDQRGGSGAAGSGAKQKSPSSSQSLEPAYSHLLKQQQVFLQLQILQNQQQQQQQVTAAVPRDSSDLTKCSGAMPLNPQPVPATTNHTPMETTTSTSTSRPEPLPVNLIDLTVSELRQQLRKRGLPVSGTKPALLQRLLPFQLPHSCVTPVPPLCQLGAGLDAVTTCPPLPPSQSPGSSCSSGLDSPSSSPNQQPFLQDRGGPDGILGESPSGILNAVVNGFTGAGSVSLAGEQRGLTGAIFLAPAGTASGTPSPSLPMSSSSPLQCGTPWRTESEQQRQQELSVELEMRERMRSRPRERCTNDGAESALGPLHPFLQQDPGSFPRGKPESESQAEMLFTQPCDVIGQDFELPVQITASPVQASPGVRTLEEELQEAIQKAQMDPRQSIDDILDDSGTPDGSLSSQYKSPAHSAASLSPPPPPPPPPPAAAAPAAPAAPQVVASQASQASQPPARDDNFLPSPLCSSLLLELPPSPAVINPSQVVPTPPPPPFCTSPLPSTGKSRKRRAPTLFDAADWLETLTSGFHPLTPPTAPFVESDFSLDSDLNVNRVLDLMIEQW